MSGWNPLKKDQVYPVGTVVRLKKTNQFAVIKKLQFYTDNENFQCYLGIIEGKGDGLYAMFHEDIELEALP